ncbi:TolC family protein [Chitinophaga sancti]|uniref:Outer membrane protein TolC n=1 Tax=Chitinophaga sancti TaxID=1004 RepID=A0A1K1S5C8_9BACT|nr:TolC family protein [Chitinophaga sancti]WQD63702.1 TolC family protein [Chitinophaga sancti]WQG90673.1 TolC family protein [Chitinophaga sancti]SFW79276.1 Outer membrane protein TolC [Chitinophaga sancti]
MKKLFTGILYCISALPVSAQLRFSSVQDLWKYADGHNIQLTASIASDKEAALSLKAAKGALLPTISANGNYTDNIRIQSTLIPAHLFDQTVPDGTFYEATFGKRYNYNTAANVQLNLINTQNWFAIKTAKLDKEIAALNIQKTRRDLYEQLANNYYSYLLADEAEKLFQSNAATMDTVFASVQRKYNDGFVSEVTINNAAINKEKATKSLVTATQNKLLQLNNLQQLLNTGDRIEISEQPVTPYIPQPFAPDPDVSLAFGEFLKSKVQWQSSKAAYAPTLSAVYQYSRTITTDHFMQFSNSNDLPSQYWGLRLSVPIFSGNNRHYTVQKTKIDMDLKQQQYQAAGLQSQLTNQNILLSYNTAFKNMEKAKEILAMYKSNDSHATQLLEEGSISIDDRLRYYSDMITNQQEYLQSMSDYFIQSYRLQIRTINIY